MDILTAIKNDPKGFLWAASLDFKAGMPALILAVPGLIILLMTVVSKMIYK